MKKFILLFLAMVMAFSFTACGNNDENNAKVQALIDESVALTQEIYDWYNDNGYLEDAAYKAGADDMMAQIEELKKSHQTIIDGDGYSDDDVVTMQEAVGSDIANFKEILANLPQE